MQTAGWVRCGRWGGMARRQRSQGMAAGRSTHHEPMHGGFCAANSPLGRDKHEADVGLAAAAHLGGQRFLRGWAGWWELMSSESRQTSAPELGAGTTPDQSAQSASSAAMHRISGPTLKILQALQLQTVQQAPARWASRHVPPTWCTLPPAPRWWQTRCTAPLAAPPRATASRASAPGRPPAGGRQRG